MKTIHENSYRVRVNDTDLFHLCRPSSLLMYLQEAASEHAALLGVSYANLAERGAVWMLVRMRYTLQRPIWGGEDLRVRTRYSSPKGRSVLRDYVLYVGSEQVGSAVSSWVLGDIVSHKLLAAEDLLPRAAPEADGPKIERLGKIIMPRELTDCARRTICYSDTDINGHANNTHYADYACDAVHFETMRGQYIREFQITYSAECRMGQTIFLKSGRDGSSLFVRGTDAEGKVHFDTRMEMCDLERKPPRGGRG